MKNKSIIYIILLISISIVYVSCNNSKKVKTSAEKTELTKTDSTFFDKFRKKYNIKSNELKDFYTKYDDGRESEIRTRLSFESFEDSLKLYPKNITKIALVVVEWEKNKGIVALESSTFTNQNNNQMSGGDVETNRRIASSSRKFIKLCEKFFDDNLDKLTKINEIPNRDLEFVSFDFVTNKGIFTVQEKLKTLENKTSIWSPLFNEGKKLKLETENIFNRKK